MLSSGADMGDSPPGLRAEGDALGERGGVQGGEQVWLLRRLVGLAAVTEAATREHRRHACGRSRGDAGHVVLPQAFELVEHECAVSPAREAAVERQRVKVHVQPEIATKALHRRDRAAARAAHAS